MKKILTTVIFCMCALCVLLVQENACAQSPGKTRAVFVSRVESHSKAGDPAGNFSGETYIYNSLSAYRSLQKDITGGVYYTNRYSIDDVQMEAHIIGLSLMKACGGKTLFSAGLSHSTEKVRTGNIDFDSTSEARLYASALRTLNPSAKRGPKYTIETGYISATDFERRQAIITRIDARIPGINRKLETGLGYATSISTDSGSQLSNQLSGTLVYKSSADKRAALSVVYIDNTYRNNPGDDLVMRLSLIQNVKFGKH